METIILCGLPGTGKSAAGKILSAKLGWQYIDTDLYLEKFYKGLTGDFLSCRDLYKKIGDAHFRDLENQMLSGMSKIEKSVISVGGGTLNDPRNIEILRKLGKIIYLKNDRKVIFERLMSKGMPAYLDPKNPFQSFEAMADTREKIYKSVADITYDTGKLSPEEIATELIKLL